MRCRAAAAVQCSAIRLHAIDNTKFSDKSYLRSTPEWTRHAGAIKIVVMRDDDPDRESVAPVEFQKCFGAKSMLTSITVRADSRPRGQRSDSAICHRL